VSVLEDSVGDLTHEPANPEQDSQSVRLGGFGDGFQLGEMSQFLALFSPALYLVLGLVEASSYLWRPLAIFLYVLLLLFGLLLAWGVSIPSVGSSQDESSDTELTLTFTFIGVVAVLVSFSQLARHLAILRGGFTFDQNGYWHWLRFGISNLLESVLLDIPAIYEWNLSEIRATSAWSRTWIFLFRTTIELVVVGIFWGQVMRARRAHRRVSRSPAKNYFDLILPVVGGLFLAMWWGLPIAVGVGAIVNDGLSIRATWLAIKTGAPAVLGFLLAWNGLRGLALTGRGNKLWSLIGVVAGIWLVREVWPMLRAFWGF